MCAVLLRNMEEVIRKNVSENVYQTKDKAFDVQKVTLMNTTFYINRISQNAYDIIQYIEIRIYVLDFFMRLGLTQEWRIL